jgi:hypothetical protein
MTAAIQLSLDRSLPVDPVALAAIPVLERVPLYNDLGLDSRQREAVEQAARAVQAGTYARRAT